MRKSSFLHARSVRANRAETMRILVRAGRDNEPISGDDLPDDLKDTRKAKEKQPPASGKRRERPSSRAKTARG